MFNETSESTFVFVQKQKGYNEKTQTCINWELVTPKLRVFSQGHLHSSLGLCVPLLAASLHRC